jgi:hypothetical protein
VGKGHLAHEERRETQVQQVAVGLKVRKEIQAPEEKRVTPDLMDRRVMTANQDELEKKEKGEWLAKRV